MALRDTKTAEGRRVPLTNELIEMPRARPNGIPHPPGLTYQERSEGGTIRHIVTAAKRAG